jgi:hypothetical protein
VSEAVDLCTKDLIELMKDLDELCFKLDAVLCRLYRVQRAHLQAARSVPTDPTTDHVRIIGGNIS